MKRRAAFAGIGAVTLLAAWQSRLAQSEPGSSVLRKPAVVEFFKLPGLEFRTARTPKDVRQASTLRIILSGRYLEVGVALLKLAVEVVNREGGPDRVEDYRWGFVAFDSDGNELNAAFFGKSYLLPANGATTQRQEKALIAKLQRVVTSLLDHDHLSPEENDQLNALDSAIRPDRTS